MGLKVKVYFVGDQFGCFIRDLGLVLCWRLILQEICIFVIVGFCSHMEIAVCFACLVAKKMQVEKQKYWFFKFLGKVCWEAGKKMKNMINGEEHMFLFWAKFEHDFLILFLFFLFNKLIF